MSYQGNKIDELQTPSGITYYVYVNQSTGDVWVVAEDTGKTSIKPEAKTSICCIIF